MSASEYADERIEGRIWKQKNILYRILYTFFKRREAEMLSIADYTVCLTEKARSEILTWKIIEHQPIPIKVIPCCADTVSFEVRHGPTALQLPRGRIMRPWMAAGRYRRFD